MKRILGTVLLTLGSIALAFSADTATELTMLTYRTGEDAGAKFFEGQVERFNQQFAGKYKITLEESPQNTHTDRIKQLALQNKLPTIFQVSDSKWVEYSGPTGLDRDVSLSA